MLKSKMDALSYVGGINVFDADGKLINASAGLARPARQRRGSTLLQDLQVRPAIAGDADRAGLQPHHRRLDHGIARKVTGPNGEFLGVIGRGIEPANFEKFFASVALGERRLDLPCTIATARCSPVIRMSTR